jgi:phage I-like protein
MKFNFLQFSEIPQPDQIEGGDATLDSGYEEVQLLRSLKSKHEYYGEVNVTPEMLLQMKANFDNKVRKLDLAIDYYHESWGHAAGWIQNVELREDNTELWLKVDWTKNGKQKIMEKEIKYISAEFDTDYTDEETGEKFGAVLLGAGLTNRPFVKEMKALFDERFKDTKYKQNEKGVRMEFEKLLEALAGLSDEQKAQVLEKLNAMPKESVDEQLATKQEEVKEKEKELSEVKVKLAELETFKLNSEKEKEFIVLLSEGKAVEAQRAAYLAGDMKNFVANAQVLNLSEKGTGKGAEETKKPLTHDEAYNKVRELAEVMSKENKIDFSEAVSKVLRQNVELEKAYNQN